jgi:hypothetical protein
VATQAPSYVGEDDVTVIELDGKRRTRKNLFDAAEYLERRFLRAILGRLGLRRSGAGSTFSIANSYGIVLLLSLKAVRAKNQPSQVRVEVRRTWIIGCKNVPIFHWRNFIDHSKDRALFE